MDEITSSDQLSQIIMEMEGEMREAAGQLEFERAAKLRDRIKTLKGREAGVRL